MKNNFKIIDCTLRDGGYYNNWNFTKNFANNYLSVLSQLGINYVEIGFKKIIKSKDFGPFSRSDYSYIKKLKIPKNLNLCAMADLSDFKNESYFSNINRIFTKKESKNIPLIRLACNYQDKNILEKVVKRLRKNNFNIAVNLMKFTVLKNNEIINFFKICKKLNVNILYLADSFGNCDPDRLIKISKELKKYFNIKQFGLHAHNNLSQALENAKTALKLGFGYIDTSLTGMGRGAGNLKLEEFLDTVKNIPQKKNENLYSLIDKEMIPLMQKYNWGPNYHYFYSAKNYIHPSFVQLLLSENKFSFYAMLEILEFLKKNKASSFAKDIFDKLFLKTNNLKNKKNFKISKILILSENSKNKKMNLNKFKRKGFKISSMNYLTNFNYKFLDYVFICNPFRIFTELNRITNLNKRIIVPSYEILKKMKFKKKEQLINYNYNKSEIPKIEEEFCKYKNNFVLFFSISFCISKNAKLIQVQNIEKSERNNNIIKDIRKIIKKNNYNTKLNIVWS